MVQFHGCGGCGDDALHSRYHDGWDQYATTNGVVVLKPCIKKYSNVSVTYANSLEVERGCWDGYGQLSSNYALQSAPHMRNVWNMINAVAVAGHQGHTPAKTDKECTASCGGR